MILLPVMVPVALAIAEDTYEMETDLFVKRAGIILHNTVDV